MNIRKVSYSLALVAMFAFAATVSAQGPSASDTASANLEMSAEVQTTVQLNIGGAAVTGSNSTGLFAIDFGNVNALGIGSQPAGVTVTTNSTGALYQTPITLTPVWTGFVAQTADIFVQAGESADQDLAREGSSLSDSGGTAVSATPSLDFVTDGANGIAKDRVVGMYIPKTEVAGSKVATLIYTVVVAP